MCTKAIVTNILLFLLFKNSHSQQYPTDTISKDAYHLVTLQKVDKLYGIPWAGDEYLRKSHFCRDKNGGKWIRLVDTIFNSKNQYQTVINHSYFKNTSIALVNSYDRNPFTDADLRFAYFIVIDTIHIVNSFRRIDGKEMYGQYTINGRNPTLKYSSKQYLNAVYDEINKDSLILEEYGLILKFDKNTKFINEVIFKEPFFEKLAPSVHDRFKKVFFLNGGKALRIE
jgi:hypothetical protein